MSEQKLKHVCKFCKKSFACGRSLGGHIRSHLPKPGYELRENPKKTWRVSNNSIGDVQTLNSAHSSEFEFEYETRYSKLRKVNQNQGNKPGFVGNTCNSSVSEVVEAEQQEEVAIAMCLIMLSRDVGPWGDASSAQGKNSKRKKREQNHGKGSIFTAVNGEKLMNLDDGHLQKGMKLKGIEVSGNGFVSNDQSNELSEGKRWKDKIEGKESVACVSDHGIPIKNKAKMKKFDGFASNDQENLSSVCKRSIYYSKLQSAASEHVKNRCKMEEFCSDFQKDNSYSDHDSVFDEYGEMCINSSISKRSKFECTTCKKVFHSYQALGGHRASHKKLNAVKDSPAVPKTEEQETVRNGESPVAQPDYEKQPPSEEVVTVIGVEQSSLSSKKLVQKHACPICFRVFSSGQALGGHKRSHMLASNSESNDKTTETKINQSFSRNAEAIERSSSSETRDMLDLNFPLASAQEESTTTLTTASSSNSLVGLIKPYWWFESSHKHELFSLISN